MHLDHILMHRIAVQRQCVAHRAYPTPIVSLPLPLFLPLLLLVPRCAFRPARSCRSWSWSWQSWRPPIKRLVRSHADYTPVAMTWLKRIGFGARIQLIRSGSSSRYCFDIAIWSKCSGRALGPSSPCQCEEII